jgi:hypothetical protein
MASDAVMRSKALRPCGAPDRNSKVHGNRGWRVEGASTCQSKSHTNQRTMTSIGQQDSHAVGRLTRKPTATRLTHRRANWIASQTSSCLHASCCDVSARIAELQSIGLGSLC